MDALLAGYGSDSDSGDSSSSAVKGDKATVPQSLSSLLGAGVDSCSSSSDDEQKKIKPACRRNSCKKDGDNNDDDDDDDTKFLTRKKKKQRSSIYDDSNDEINSTKKKTNTFLTTNCLPLPRTTSTNPEQQSSMISWSVDYLSHQPSTALSTSTTDDNSDNNNEFRKFEKLTTSLPDDKMGWAAHLQNQQEFHNPHFFQSAIEYFGIDEPLGSQANDRINTR
jgi:hypothetical protein